MRTVNPKAPELYGFSYTIDSHGVVREKWGKRVPRISNDVLNTAVYFYKNIADARSGTGFGGCGGIVANTLQGQAL